MGIDLNDTHSRNLSENQLALKAKEVPAWQRVTAEATKDPALRHRFAWITEEVKEIQRGKGTARKKTIKVFQEFCGGIFYSVMRGQRERWDIWHHLHIKTRAQIEKNFIEACMNMIQEENFPV